MGLDNSIFRMIISQILNMNPLSSLESAYSMAIQEERHSLITRGKDARSDAITFVACLYEKTVFCSIYAKMGHSESEWF